MNNLDDTVRRSHLAIYRAAQAVVAVDLGISVTRVSLDDGRGPLDFAVWPCAELYTAADRHARKRVARNMIIALYAGREAERMVFSKAIDDIAERDEEMAFRISVDFKTVPRSMREIGDESHRRCLNALRREAREALQERMQTVGRLAAALIGRGTLTGDAVDRVLAGDGADIDAQAETTKRRWWSWLWPDFASLGGPHAAHTAALQRKSEQELAELRRTAVELGEALCFADPPTSPA